MLFARWDQLRTNSARPVGAEAVSGAATEVPRQKFELALSGSATTGRSSLGHQCAVHPEPVRLALLLACHCPGPSSIAIFWSVSVYLNGIFAHRRTALCVRRCYGLALITPNKP